MERQYYFGDDFTGAEYRVVIDLVGRKANFVGLVFSVGIGREERLAFEGRVSELGGIVIESSEWPGTVYYGGERKIAVFRLNERVLDFIRTAQESVFAWQEPDSPVEDLHFFRKDWAVMLIFKLILCRVLAVLLLMVHLRLRLLIILTCTWF